MAPIDIDMLIAERYRVVAPLGEGGMARVFEARDELLDRPVALKVLRERFAADTAFAERFRREARAVASLNHPNVVQVYDCGEGTDGGPSWIAMELIEGGSLAELARHDAPMDHALATSLVRQAACGLGFAHARGLVHRDVKPHNMLLDGRGALKVTDFGIARTEDAGQTLTEVGTVVGTARYLSPEAARGERVGPASDVYALGVVLYELVTGQAPFLGSTPVEVALRQVQDDPIAPHRLAPGIDPRLEHVILRALDKDPARRPANGDEFAAALDREDLPATVVTPIAAAATVPIGRSVGRVHRWSRRRIAAVVLGALAVLLVAIVAITSADDSGGNGGSSDSPAASTATDPSPDPTPAPAAAVTTPAPAQPNGPAPAATPPGHGKGKHAGGKPAKAHKSKG
ncbi:MAG: hypothetical protein JWM98_2724 [Thermoleophilia bacterium]|nr:hypothetical protein [Thermoleophilia bacterium]